MRHFGALVHPLLGVADADSVHEIVGPMAQQRRSPGSVHILVIVGVRTCEKVLDDERGARGQSIYSIGLGGAEKSVPSYVECPATKLRDGLDRKSTRLNSSLLGTSYAVFC